MSGAMKPISILVLLVIGAMIGLMPVLQGVPDAATSSLSISWDTSSSDLYPGFEEQDGMYFPNGESLDQDILIVSQAVSSDPSHAFERHGIEANMARECSTGQHALTLFKNPVTGRIAYVCLIDGLWGMHILDEMGNEVTAFLKNKMKTFEQVLKYMRNSGYELLQ